MNTSTAAFDPQSMVHDTGESSQIGDGGTYRKYTVSANDLYPNSLVDLWEHGQITDDEARLAVTPRQDTQTDLVPDRSVILEKARHHFTNRLIEQIGPGISLRILRETEGNEPSNWRL